MADVVVGIPDSQKVSSSAKQPKAPISAPAKVGVSATVRQHLGRLKARASSDPAASAARVKQWYDDLKALGKKQPPADPNFADTITHFQQNNNANNELYDRSRWRPEAAAVTGVWLLTLYNFTVAIGSGSKAWATLLISFFVEAVFLFGPAAGAFLDKRYCPWHEVALLKTDKPWQAFLVWPLVFVAFQFGVITVFQLVPEAVNVSFYVGVVGLVSFLGLTLYIPCRQCGKTAAAVRFRDALDLQLERKFKRRAGLGGKPRQSRAKVLWGNTERIVKGVFKDLILLGMLSPARAPAWARCACVFLLTDVLLERPARDAGPAHFKAGAAGPARH